MKNNRILSAPRFAGGAKHAGKHDLLAEELMEALKDAQIDLRSLPEPIGGLLIKTWNAGFSEGMKAAAAK